MVIAVAVDTDQRGAGITDTGRHQDPMDEVATALQDEEGMVLHKVDEEDTDHHQGATDLQEEAEHRHQDIKARTTAEGHRPVPHTKTRANMAGNSHRARPLLVT